MALPQYRQRASAPRCHTSRGSSGSAASIRLLLLPNFNDPLELDNPCLFMEEPISGVRTASYQFNANDVHKMKELSEDQEAGDLLNPIGGLRLGKPRAFIVFESRRTVISGHSMDADSYQSPKKTLVDLQSNAHLKGIAWPRACASISKSSASHASVSR